MQEEKWRCYWVLPTGFPLSLCRATQLAGCKSSTASVLSAGDQRIVAQEQACLDGLRDLHARFTSSVASWDADGLHWLDPPCRLCVQYMHPPTLVVPKGGRLLFVNEHTCAMTGLPVSDTLVGILLANHVGLSDAVTVDTGGRTAMSRGPSWRRPHVWAWFSHAVIWADVACLARCRRAGRIGTLDLCGLSQLVQDTTTDPDLFRSEQLP